jgi:hypothetical protein
MSNQAPTPDTDAVVFGFNDDKVSSEVARRLERERDEARADVDMARQGIAILRTEAGLLQEDLCRWRLAWEQASLERRQWRECAERLRAALKARGGHCRACCDDDKDDDLALAEFERLKGQAQ